VIDLLPAVRSIAQGCSRRKDVSLAAARFHETIAVAIAEACRLARSSGAPKTVVLSGGCFQNARLTERATVLLEGIGFEVLTHRRAPPNDGGLSLGQAAVASFHMSGRQR
jgi:hydrogenase maturation protein HypF